MTAVVAIIDNQKIIMGADSCASNRSSKCIRKDEKVFRVDDFLIGFSGSFRVGNLLRYKLSEYLESQRPDVDDSTFMNTVFIDGVKECLNAGGVEFKNKGEEFGGHIIVGYHDNLYMIDCDYQVGMHHDRYMATGSGGQVALGSLFSTENKFGNKKRVLLALEAASKYAVGVDPPFVIKEMGIKKR